MEEGTLPEQSSGHAGNHACVPARYSVSEKAGTSVCRRTRLPVELHRPIRVLWDTHERLNYGINIWGIGISSINRTIPKLFAETRRLFIQVKYERSHKC